MQEQLISFETAKSAKEKGFKEKTELYYSSSTKSYSVSYDEFAAPTQSLLQKWLRNNYNIDIVIKVLNGDKIGEKNYAGDVFIFNTKQYIKTSRRANYETVLENCLKEALKLI